MLRVRVRFRDEVVMVTVVRKIKTICTIVSSSSLKYSVLVITDCVKAVWVIIKYVIGHTHLHQSLQHFSLVSVATSATRVCTPILMQLLYQAFSYKWDPFGSGSNTFENIFPNKSLRHVPRFLITEQILIELCTSTC